jgi:hypothetical protein
MRFFDLLTEQTSNDETKLIAKIGQQWIWTISKDTYNQIRNRWKEFAWKKFEDVPPDASSLWLVSDQTQKAYGFSDVSITPENLDEQIYHWKWIIFAKQGLDLIHLAGLLNMSKSLLTKLAKISGAENAPGLDLEQTQRHVLYRGQVKHAKEVMQNYALELLKDGSQVYKIPKHSLWTIGIRYRDSEESPNWNTLYRIKHPLAGTIDLWVQDNRVVLWSFPSSKLAQSVRAIQELTARDSLMLTKPLPVPDSTETTKNVKPGSVMHKMLAYIADHPGASRSDWFVKHLGRSPVGMVGWTDPKAHDGIAAGMGWIKNKGSGSKYSLHITNIGRLVLARLNKGVAAPYTKEI